MSKYPALFALAFSLAAGWTLGRLASIALFRLAARYLDTWREKKRKRVFR